MKPIRGFTLLELLVAVAIFALLGVGSYRLLASTINTRDGDSVAAVVLKNNVLELTRAGLPNPLKQVRSDLQRISYQINTKNELVRSAWQQLDRDRGVKPQQTVLLTKIKTMTIKTHNQNGGTNNDWPSFQGSPDTKSLTELPRSIEVTMNVEPWGEVTRVFALPQSIEPKSATQ